MQRESIGAFQERKKLLEMIVTLNDSGWPAKQLRKKHGQVLVSLCSHNPIDHMFGDPCIQIHGFSAEDKEKARRLSDLKHIYPLVHQRNILSVLGHESIHCAAQKIDEDDASLDEIIGLTGKSRRILEVA